MSVQLRCCVLLLSCVWCVAQFSDQTIASGLVFTHTLGETHTGKQMEGGGTVGDFNRDGWPDLFIMGGGGRPDGLFINNQDGTFTDQAAAWGVASQHFGVGAAVGDYNRDGWPDIYVTSFGSTTANVGPGYHRLYRNNQGQSFTDVAVAAGVDTTALTQHDGFSSAYGDYDLDGDLDLFVTGWFENSDGNLLFQNNGDGTFNDVTDLAGIDRGNTRGFSVHFGDMNGDRYPELLVTADFNSSHYYANLGNGTFADMTLTSGCCVESNGMGGFLADYNNDLLLDWHITSIFRDTPIPFDGNILMVNQGNHQLNALPASCGLRDGGWAWGTVGLDYNHDGWLDIISTNGWAAPEFRDFPTTLFHNNSDLTFSDVAQSMGIQHTLQGRGLVHFDYDRDGDMDLVVFANDDVVTLYRNDVAGATANWVQFESATLHHPGLAADGFGTQVTITANTFNQAFEINGNANFLGNSEPIAHFGLGSQSTSVMVDFVWPDGSALSYSVAPNARYRMVAPHSSVSLPANASKWQNQWALCFDATPTITHLVDFVGQGGCPPLPQ